MTIFTPVYLALALFAQAPAGGLDADDGGVERLKFMKDVIRSCEFSAKRMNPESGGDPPAPRPISPERPSTDGKPANP